jgi:transcriptional regulator with XRE-family HTH domain
MNPNWSQQEVFCSRIKEYAEHEGLVSARGALNFPALAARFDLGPTTIKQFVQNKKRPRPHFDTLNNIAGVINKVVPCKVMESWDDVNTPLPGVTPERWAEASERDRVLSSALLEDLMSIPEAEKEAYLKLYDEGVFKGLARLKVEQEAKEGAGGKKP